MTWLRGQKTGLTSLVSIDVKLTRYFSDHMSMQLQHEYFDTDEMQEQMMSQTLILKYALQPAWRGWDIHWRNDR